MTTVRYINRDLTTGLNDGTSEANAWQSCADIVWAYGLHLHWKTAVYAETITYSLPTLTKLENSEPIVVEGYAITPGDGEYAIADMGGFRFYNYGYVSNIFYKNMEFIGANVWGSPFLTNAVKAHLYNCRFINTYVDSIARGATAVDLDGVTADNCYFESHNAGMPSAELEQCAITRCVFNAAREGVLGIFIDINGAGSITDCIIKYTGSGKSGPAIYLNNGNVAKPFVIANNVIDGFETGVYNFEATTWDDTEKPHFVDNIISNCELVFENSGAGSQEHCYHIGSNAYFNFGAKYNSILGHSDSVGFDVECLVDPFVDRESGDYNLNDDAMGGALLKNTVSIGAGILSNLPNISYGAIQADAQIIPPVAAVTVPAAILMVI